MTAPARDKVCMKCHTKKPVGEFYHNGLKHDNECSECRKARQRAYYAKNREALRAKAREKNQAERKRQHDQVARDLARLACLDDSPEVRYGTVEVPQGITDPRNWTYPKGRGR